MDTLTDAITKARQRATVTVGLDLGKLSDHTALVVSEAHRGKEGAKTHTIRMIERLALGTSYPDICDRVAEVMMNLEGMVSTRDDLARPALVVDATGVGIAAIDLLMQRGLKPVAVTITGTDRAVERADGVLSVGKTFMVSRLQVLLQSARLKLPRTPEAALLVDELKDYELEYTPAGNVTFNARSGKHDDLVLALALAVTVDVPKSKRKIPASVLGVHGVARPGERGLGEPAKDKGQHYRKEIVR
ncbi:MAG: hypothetical protein M9950_07115 [Thermomicrobiales bacterium]|nr:hypothetical protein [Thermomicrobiales bacterium]